MMEWYAYKTNGGTVHLEVSGDLTEFPDWAPEVLHTLRAVCAGDDNSVHGISDFLAAKKAQQ